MQTTNNTPIGGGWQDPDATPAVDPNAPVEQPRRCGLCSRFGRFSTVAAEPRTARFGTCSRPHGTPEGSITEAPVDLGPSVVGDLFGCVFFEARQP